MSRRRRGLAWCVALVILALAIDRIALFVWQLQVIKLYRSMRRVADSGEAKPPETRFGYISIGLEPLLVMPSSPDAPIRFTTLRTDMLLAKPSTVTVDGAGGVHLRFLPPIAAWTTWVIPRTDPGHHSDPVAFDPRLHYQYKIDIVPDKTSDSVAVTLARGPFHFYNGFEGDQSPVWFP